MTYAPWKSFTVVLWAPYPTVPHGVNTQLRLAHLNERSHRDNAFGHLANLDSNLDTADLLNILNISSFAFEMQVFKMESHQAFASRPISMSYTDCQSLVDNIININIRLALLIATDSEYYDFTATCSSQPNNTVLNFGF